MDPKDFNLEHLYLKDGSVIIFRTESPDSGIMDDLCHVLSESGYKNCVLVVLGLEDSLISLSDAELDRIGLRRK